MEADDIGSLELFDECVSMHWQSSNVG